MIIILFFVIRFVTFTNTFYVKYMLYFEGFKKTYSGGHNLLRLFHEFTAWKVSKYGIIYSLYFPVFELKVNLCIQSEYRKI